MNRPDYPLVDLEHTPPDAGTGPLAGLPMNMTLAQAAEGTGYSTEYYARLIRRGILPAYRMRGGRRLIILRRDIEALLEPVEVTR